MDIALGGEAAPLAPLAHLWLFGDRKLGRAVQNIGGIAQSDLSAAAARPGDRRVIAFDTGPGVMLIDALARKLLARPAADGSRRKNGCARKVSATLLAELMRDPYFRRRPPKSTGREQFGPHYLAKIEARARGLSRRGDDLIATVTALTARSIADACRRFAMPWARSIS